MLVFLVSGTGIRLATYNVQKILDFPKPQNKTDVRAFVSLEGFYRRHVNCFSDVAAPLNEILKKRNVFQWSTKEDHSFEQLKQVKVTAVQLKYPNPKVRYKVYCDASDLGIGGVLVQADEETGEDRPICFVSRKLKHEEMRYPTVEKECLAFMFLLARLRRYLLDKEFDAYTDSTSVHYLFTKSSPGSRLQRWIIAVQEYKFRIHHVPGKQNVIADIMSRYPLSQMTEEDMESPDEYLQDSWLVELIEEQDYEDRLLKIWQKLNKAADGIQYDD